MNDTASSHNFKLKVAITEKINKWKWFPITHGTHKEYIDASTENLKETGAKEMLQAKYTNATTIIK